MNWSKSKLGELAFFQRGFDITKKEQEEGEYPVVSSSGTQSFHSKATVKGPGVVIGRKGTLGSVFYIEGDFWAHDTTLWVKDFQGNNPKFVYYFLKTLELGKFDSGGANPTLNRNHIHGIEILKPPVATQERIAKILSNYDRLIDNNTRRIALLEESIHRLYQEWFVYLRFPGCDRVAIVDGVPEGWRKISLGQCADKSGGVVQTGPFGSQLHQHDYRDSGTPVVMPKDIRNDQIVTTSIAYVDDETINRLSRHTLKVGDIVLPRRGDLNKRALITNQQSGWLCGTGCLKISIPNEFISSRYLFFYLKQPQVVERIENQAVGATMLNLSASILQSVEVIVPCSQTQHDFDQITHSILDQISLLNHYNFKLREARALLLPRLMNGSIPV